VVSRPRPHRTARRSPSPAVRRGKPTLPQRAALFLPLRSWRLQVAGAAVGITAAILSAQSMASARETVASYLVQPGDSLSRIATTTGVSVDKLINLNGIKNPDFIVAGQTLSLDGSAPAPSATPSASASAAPMATPSPTPTTAPGTSSYTVRSGDTLWDIAVSTGATVDTIVKLNNLSDSDALTIGQVLTVPAASSSRPSPSPTARPAQTRTGGSPSTAGGQTAALVVPKPTVAPKLTLQQKIANEVQKAGGGKVRVGVSAVNLVTGEKVGLNGDDVFPSASVMKLPILVELERQIATGKLSWTDSLRDEAGAMIAVSDNSAANQIADVIKTGSVNDTMSKLGLANTRFLNLFDDTRKSSNPGQNQTTPNNMTHLLNLLATDQVVSSQVSADIRALLARNTDRSKLVRLLPAEARVAHKSGWYDGVANDVGIVTVDRVPARWVIAVFTQNLPDAETGNQLVATISRAVYDAWAP
jgi:beta-lactamase class A